MNKKLLIVGLVGLFALALGAVIFEAQKDTVSTWGDCVSAYLEDREQMPPIPLPSSAEELLKMAESGDWSFMADAHWYIRQPMTLYVAENSELAKHFKLPAKLIVMEDIRLGEIILFSVKNEEKAAWTPEASFTAPAIIDETDLEYAKLSSEEKSRELFFELSYRRIIGEITLEPASALTELFKVDEASSLLSSDRDAATTLEDGGGTVMRSSFVPSNTLWLSIDGTTLTLHAPENFTNRMEIYGANTLFDPWEIEVQTLQPTYTNPVSWSPSPAPMKHFYCPGDMDRDEDGDGVPTDREKRVYKTNPNNADSDGDGYSDGPTWPAGYGGVMRGLNDAFPNDAAAWRDTDGDGLPNEVVGYSELEEDLDDDGDGTNEMTVAGIWLSADELSGLSTNNVQWENLLEEANRPMPFIEIADQDNWANVVTMAKALVYAKTENEAYRTQVIDACTNAIGTESNGTSLALGRNLGGFIIAADLVDLPQADDMLFRDWLKTMLTNSMSDGKSLKTAHESLANDNGTHAGGARAAIAAYLQEWDELDDIAKVFKGWTGDTNSYSGFTDFGADLSWQADTNAPVGINPKDATIQGVNVDGALPVALQEVSGFTNDPPQGDYAYEHLQGALLQAVILDRAGYGVWDWEDKALLRAFEWVKKEADTLPEEDDSWQPFIVNHYYSGTNLPAGVTSKHGKNIAPTDWTHPALDSDEDGLPDWWELEHFGGTTNALSDADPDSDHLINLDEYLAETDPNRYGDADSDGMSDDWEGFYGLNPTNDVDELVDSDGDRIPNRYEYEYYTSPSDRLSLPSPTITGTVSYAGGIKQAVLDAITTESNGYPIILLEAGTYTGGDNKNVPLSASNILIYATNATATIDCQNAGRAFYITAGRPVIAGLVMRNGEIVYSGHGGAIYSANAALHLRNCVFVSNEVYGAQYDAGAVYAQNIAPVIENCTFLNNYAGRDGGAIRGNGLYVKVINSLLWGNRSDRADPQAHLAHISYSCVEGGYSGTGNTTNDPVLVTNDWHLASTNSSCWNNGNPVNAPASDIDGDLRDAQVDIGADEFQ